MTEMGGDSSGRLVRRGWNLLRLIPTLVGLMMQVGPGEAEANIRYWPRLLGWETTDQCLHGMPPAVIYATSAILIVAGVVWFFWPEASVEKNVTDNSGVITHNQSGGQNIVNNYGSAKTDRNVGGTSLVVLC